MKRSSSRCTTNQKEKKIPQNRSLLVHIVTVDTKVANASLALNQCLQCVSPPLMHVEIPRPRDATELTMTA